MNATTIRGMVLFTSLIAFIGGYITGLFLGLWCYATLFM